MGEPDAGSEIPTVIATHQNGTKHFALDDKRIYWTTFGPDPDSTLDIGLSILRSCAKDDCAGTLVTYATSSQAAIGPIATNGRNVYFWLSTLDGACRFGCLHICPVEGCPSKPTQIANLSLVSMAADVTHIYWLSGDATLQRCPAAGCGGHLPELVALTGSTTNDRNTLGSTFIVDETSIVWFQYDGPGLGRIVEFEKGGTKPLRSIAEGTLDTQALAADISRIYWNEYPVAEKPYPLKTCSRAGCGSDYGIFADQGGYPTLIAAGGGRVAWFLAASQWFHKEEPPEPAELFECPSSGCGSAPKSILTSPMPPCAMAVDDTHIYWRTCFDYGFHPNWEFGDGAIQRVKR
jgi:hypothetical protein